MMEQREKLIELLEQCNKEYPSTFKNLHFELAYVADKFLANGVVVLPCRCKDCEHRGTDDCPMHIKGVSADEEFLTKVDNDYCSYGKRKGGD